MPYLLMVQHRTTLPRSFNATPREIKGEPAQPDTFQEKGRSRLAPSTHGFQVYKFRKDGQPFFDPENGRSTHFLHPMVAQRYAEERGLQCIPLSATPS